MFSVASHRVKAGCWRHQLVFVFIFVFVNVFVFVFVFCCVACPTVSRLSVGGVRGSVVTILMAAIPEPSHTVSYTGQPPIYGAIYINTLLYVELLVLYMPADKQLGETAVWISWAMCTQTIIAHILSQICVSTYHKYVHAKYYCAHKFTFTNMSPRTKTRRPL